MAGGNLIMGIGNITGTDDDDILVVGGTSLEGDVGKACHYNGVDWFDIQELKIPNVGYGDVTMIEGEIFVVGKSTSGFPDKTFILHGK